jgi:hypothetical protein
MSDLLEKDRSIIRGALLSPCQSSRVSICGLRQVLKHHFSDFPHVRSNAVRPEKRGFPRTPRPYWQERGWRRYGRVYVGSYQVNGQSFGGQARKNETNTGFDFYIIDPPPQVRRSPCFHNQGEGWFWVHWHNETAPRTVCSGLMGIEKKLSQLLHP